MSDRSTNDNDNDAHCQQALSLVMRDFHLPALISGRQILDSLRPSCSSMRPQQGGRGTWTMQRYVNSAQPSSTTQNIEASRVLALGLDCLQATSDANLNVNRFQELLRSLTAPSMVDQSGSQTFRGLALGLSVCRPHSIFSASLHFMPPITRSSLQAFLPFYIKTKNAGAPHSPQVHLQAKQAPSPSPGAAPLQSSEVVISPDVGKHSWEHKTPTATSQEHQSGGGSDPAEKGAYIIVSLARSMCSARRA